MRCFLTFSALFFFISIFNLLSTEFYWRQTAIGLEINHCISFISTISNGEVLFGAIDEHVYSTTNKGNEWERVLINNIYTPTCFCNHTNGEIILGFSNGKVLHSNDYGKKWESCGYFSYQDKKVVSIKEASNGNLYIANSEGLITEINTNWEFVKTLTKCSGTDFTDMVIDNMGNIFYSSSNGGVSRSSDNGQSWQVNNSGFVSFNVSRLVTNSSGIICACTNEGLYRSLDRGFTWNPYCYEISGKNATDFIWATANKQIALAQDDIYFTTDNGFHWISIKSDIQSTNFLRINIDFEGYIYVGCANGMIFRMLNPIEPALDYLSIDVAPVYHQSTFNGGGLLYNVIIKNYKDEPLENAEVMFGSDFLGAPLFTVTDTVGIASCIVPISVNVWQGLYKVWFQATKSGFANSELVYRYVHVDTAELWKENLNFTSLQRPNSFVGFGKDTIIASTIEGTINRSSDGGNTWQILTDGLEQISCKSNVIKNAKDELVFIRGANSVAISPDRGDTWQYYPCPIYMDYLKMNYTGTIFGVRRYLNYIYCSYDNGMTWDTIKNGESPFFSITDYFVDINEIFLAVQSSGLVYSTDNGSTWSNKPLPKSSIYINNEVSPFSVYRSNNGILFVGAGPDGVIASKDNGNSWVFINNGIDKSKSSPNSYDLILAFKEIDNVIFCYGYTGIYYSTNSGSLWVKFNDGLDTITHQVLDIFTSGNGILYCGVSDYKLYQRKNPFSHTTDVEEQIVYFDKENPLIIYPNPANEGVVLSFDSENAASANIEIIEINSGEVIQKEIVLLSVGNNRIFCSIAGLAQGSYIVRINAGVIQYLNMFIISR